MSTSNLIVFHRTSLSLVDVVPLRKCLYLIVSLRKCLHLIVLHRTSLGLVDVAPLRNIYPTYKGQLRNLSLSFWHKSA